MPRWRTLAPWSWLRTWTLLTSKRCRECLTGGQANATSMQYRDGSQPPRGCKSRHEGGGLRRREGNLSRSSIPQFLALWTFWTQFWTLSTVENWKNYDGTFAAMSEIPAPRQDTYAGRSKDLLSTEQQYNTPWHNKSLWVHPFPVVLLYKL